MQTLDRTANAVLVTDKSILTEAAADLVAKASEAEVLPQQVEQRGTNIDVGGA